MSPRRVLYVKALITRADEESVSLGISHCHCRFVLVSPIQLLSLQRVLLVESDSVTAFSHFLCLQLCRWKLAIGGTVA